MTHWHPLEPAHDDFFRTAPAKTVQVLDTRVPVEKLRAALTADDAVVSWGPGVTATRWLGERPFGVGTVREVTVGGAVTVRETFYQWEEGRRKTFAVTESSRPGIRRFAEDYVVEHTATGSRLTWTVAVEVARFANPTRFLLEKALSVSVGSMVNGLRKRLDGR